MELPESLISESISENQIYFFTKKSSIGVQNHMHVCIKKKNKILIFATCTSQTSTVLKLARYKNIDPNTFPCIKKSKTNGFTLDLTYVNCNNLTVISPDKFADMIKNREIFSCEGELSDVEMQSIAKGVKLSIMVTKEIKDLF